MQSTIPSTEDKVFKQETVRSYLHETHIPVAINKQAKYQIIKYVKEKMLRRVISWRVIEWQVEVRQSVNASLNNLLVEFRMTQKDLPSLRWGQKNIPNKGNMQRSQKTHPSERKTSVWSKADESKDWCEVRDKSRSQRARIWDGLNLKNIELQQG